MKFYRSYPAGKQVAWRGDELSIVASVVRGVASLSTQMEDGRKQMVGLLLPSDFYGRPGRQRALFDRTAATDLLLCCFHRKPFEAMMIATPHVGQRLLSMTLDELDSARDWMVLLGRKQARERIASLLSLLARRAAPHPDGLIDLPLTREAIADYLGLTFETVSRHFSHLRRDGIIALQTSRQFRVLDAAALEEATGGAFAEEMASQ